MHRDTERGRGSEKPKYRNYRIYVMTKNPTMPGYGKFVGSWVGMVGVPKEGDLESLEEKIPPQMNGSTLWHNQEKMGGVRRYRR